MNRLFLTGYRGTGKSTVGRVVAERLGWDAIDSDDEIERRAGKSIAQMFTEDGEPAFRDLEEQVVADLCQQDTTVIALGGGAILRPATRQRIGASGAVVWLTASPEAIAERLATDVSTATRRPNLTATGGVEEVRHVLAEREPLYRQCATLVLETEGRSPEAIADDIVRWSSDHGSK